MSARWLALTRSGRRRAISIVSLRVVSRAITTLSVSSAWDQEYCLRVTGYCSQPRTQEDELLSTHVIGFVHCACPSQIQSVFQSFFLLA
jgi:hypothetical protein